MPPVHTIHFDPDGGALQARLGAGQAALGSYSLIVLAPDEVTLVPPSPFDADFDGPAANTHALPGTAAANEGRVLDVVYSVGLMDVTRAFAVHLAVLQDGRVVGTASDVGTDTDSGETHKGEILVKLTGVSALASMRAASRSRNATKRGGGR